MELVDSLIARYFPSPGHELYVSGVPISRIVHQSHTPVFVYDRQVLDQSWERLQETLPSCFSVYYSVKANPNGTILKYFLGKGCGLEVASGGELHQALRAGCEPSQIIYAGPGKTDDELVFALNMGVGEVHAESITEIDRIVAHCVRLGVTSRVALRINPSADLQGGALRMGGKPAPFGIDEEQVDFALDRVLSSKVIEFAGIHLYLGTQVLDYAVLLAQYGNGLEIASRIASQSGQSLQTVDFGGGFGIPYFAHEQALDMTAFQRGLAKLFAEWAHDRAFAGTQFIVEPGRYLVGEAAIYVTRVSDIKVSRGKKFVVVDGGMHHHLAASGNLGQTIKRNFPIAVLNKVGEPPAEEVDVVGPLCTPLDTLGRAVHLPCVELGDLIGIFQSGAYARAASPLGFLSHLSPPEVWVRDGRFKCIRRRGTYDDYLRDLL